MGGVFSLLLGSINEGESKTLSDEEAANLKNAIDNQYYIRFISHNTAVKRCNTVLHASHLSESAYKIVIFSSYETFSKNEIQEYSFSGNTIIYSRVITLNNSSDVIFDLSAYEDYDDLSKADSDSLKSIFGTPSDWNKWRQYLGANNENPTEVDKTYNLFIKTSVSMSQITDVYAEYTDENNGAIILTSIGYGESIFFGSLYAVFAISCQDGVYSIGKYDTTA